MLAAHHLVVDGVSWRVLLEDLQAAYAALSRAGAVSLLPTTTPFPVWAARLAREVEGGAFDGEAAYWTDPARADAPPLPLDFPGGSNRVGDADGVSADLSAEDTATLLAELPRLYRAGIADALLASVARAAAAWTGSGRLLVDVEGHGREEAGAGGADLSRTVGWFTTLHPLLVDVGGAAGADGALKAVKEQARAVPNRGIGHGALRWLHPDPAVRSALAAMPAAGVRFEYLGRLDGALEEGGGFALSPAGAGGDADPRGPRSHPFAVTAVVSGGRLRVRWQYARTLHRRETVQRLAEALAAELRVLAAHCRAAEAGGYTPSDFPLARLSAAALDRHFAGDRGVEDVYPLTPIQEGILFHTLLEEGSGVYVSQLAFDLVGDVDDEALANAWDAAVRLHPALRTAFLWEGVEPAVQVVRRGVSIPFVHERWLDAGADEREARFAAFLARDRARGFDLRRAPPLRLALFRTGERERRMVWTQHHALIDGWSVPRVLADVAAFYDALTRGGPPPRREARPYRDYVAWLAGRDRGAAEAFWRGYLEGFDTPTPLPFDRPAAGEEGEGTADLRLPLSAAADGALREFARHGVTLNTLLQGAWALLLSRYAGGDDVVFGTTVLDRPAELAGIEETVGLFVNTLPVRARVLPGARALPWLRALQAAQAELREHAHTPLLEVQRWCGVAAGTPLFESNVHVEDYPLQRVDASGGRRGFRVEPLRSAEQSSYPLSVGLGTRGGAALHAQHDRARFEGAAVERMLAHLAAVLEALAADPERRLADVGLLPAAERARVLSGWNATRAAYPATRTVHALFAEAAARTPDAVALVWDGGEMTFGELRARTDWLARRLRAAGVGPDSRVGVCLGRGPELAAALLGVMAAGGAYVALDPAYPAERLASVARDAALAALVTTRSLDGTVPDDGVPVLWLDGPGAFDPAADADLSVSESIGSDETEDGARGLAYVIYTSGSTGRPKAVGVENGPAAAHFLEFRDFLGLVPGDRFLLFASPSFDASVEQLFPALLAGAAVVLMGEELWPPQEFLARCRRHGVSVVDLPSVYLQRVLHDAVGSAEPAGALRLMMSGGEALPPDAVRAWEAGPAREARLFNAYGPTEAVITSSAWELRPGALAAAARRVPIGPPFPQRAVYVLDAHGNPLPAGVPGELCIGGPLLARGYLGRPALTADRFVPDPFGRAGGARLYRTGDQARWLDDGTLDILGRVDLQVKMRGFRIEPEEVEAALMEHPAVGEAVVAARADASGEVVLAAWLAPAAGYRATADGLRTDPASEVSFWASPGEYPVYDDLLYRAMTEDARRNQGYRDAIAACVAGKVAVDVGTGSDVVLTRMCVEAGARKVYAVEVMEESFLRARARIRELGLEDRVVLLLGDATTLELPEPADVCVSELLGNVGSSEGTVAILNHARRWLKPGGVMVPRRFETMVAAATLPDALHADPGFSELAAPYAERVFEVVGHRGDLRLMVRNFPLDHLLSAPGLFEAADLVEWSDPDGSRRVEMAVSRAGRLDGLLLWLRLYPGEPLAVDSLEHETSWLPVFFPVFYPGVEVGPGDRIVADCEARLSDDGVHPDYHLRGVLRRADGSEAPFAYDSLHHRPPAAPNALHRRMVTDDGVRIRPARDERVAPAELRAFLKARLPEYMVPTAFVAMDRLPLTHNGKVDRRALPAPEARSGGAGAAPPRTPAEEVLAGIWAEVLEGSTPGIHDDFFVLGGHSLRATRLMSRIRAAFGVDLPLRAVFEAPTVAGQAARVEAALREGSGGAPPPLLPVPRAGGLPLSFAQRRLWFLDRLAGGTSDYNLPVALRLEGPLDAGALRRALDEIAGRHEVLRTVFREEGGEPVQEALPGVSIPLPQIDLSALPPAAREARVRELAVEESRRRFDLSAGPLLRATLLHLAPEESVLLFTLHHVASDEWSTEVLVREVNVLYAAFRAGRPSPLAPLPVQYADFAAWQRGWMRGEVLESRLAWWRRALAGLPAPTPIPFDLPGGAPPAGAFAVRPVAREAAEALRARARAEGATPFMAVVAALAVLLRHLTGEADLAIGANAGGRERIETEGLIGFFVNPLVLRADLSGDPTLSGVLGRVRESTLGAFAHQDLPFEELVDALRPERGDHPLFRVKVDFGNGLAESPALDGVRATPLPAGPPPVRYDLLLGVTDAPEGMTLAVTYDTRRLREETVEGMISALQEVLAALAGTPDEPLSAVLARLDEADRARRAERQARLRQSGRDRLRGRARPVLDTTN
ncbi:MAG TPA: amino acid adenylation domain-containing protein [Longimicrobium sp.]|nr:amino acid adenylation domain-containing protein [Longimicrobium sp.]